MSIQKGVATLGGGNIMMIPGVPELLPHSAYLRTRSINIHKINYTNASPDYGAQWKSANEGMQNTVSNFLRPYSNMWRTQSGTGMVLRMTDDRNYYVAYTYNHPFGPNMDKRYQSSGQGFYVDKVVNGVRTNLYFKFVNMTDNQYNTTPYIHSFGIKGDAISYIVPSAGVNFSGTDASLTAIGNAGTYMMSWNFTPPWNLISTTI